MADRSVVLRLRAEVGAYKAAMGEATKATDAFGDSANKNSVQASSGLAQVVESASKHDEAWRTVGTTLLGVGTATAAGVGLAIAKYSEFDAAMSAVQASTGASKTSLVELREAALQAGADTQFSATEAAGAIEELAKAGVSTEDILSGGLNGALALAAAGGISVAEAAEVAASTLTQFSLSGRDVGHVADLLAAGANKAQGGVGDLGAALNQSGLVASQFGLSVEETVGSLAAFASAGLLGSDAGTSFRSMLLRLANPAKETQETMDALGISAYDAQGNFVGVADLAQQLQDRLGGLTQAQRDAALAQIFGSDAIRAANILYTEGAEGINGWVAAVDDSGAAAETAAARTDNLRGDVERLGGAFDTALIRIGASADGPLRAVVQTITDVVDAFGSAPPAVQSTALVLGTLVAAASLASGGFLVLAPRILETRAAVNQLSTDMPRATGALKTLGRATSIVGGVVALAGALIALGVATRDAGDPQGVNELSRSLDRLAEDRDFSGIDDAFSDFGSGLFGIGELNSQINGLDDAITRVFNPTTEQSINDFLSGLVPSAAASTELGSLKAVFDDIDESLAGLVSSGNAEAAAEQFAVIEERMRAQGVSAEDAARLFPLYADALIGAEEAAAGAGEGAQAAAGGIDAAATSAEQAQASLEGFQDALDQLLDQAFGVEEATDSLTGAFAELAENASGYERTLSGTSEAALANRESVRGLVEGIFELADAQARGGASSEELVGSLQAQRAGLEDALTAMGFSREEVQRYAAAIDPATVAAQALTKATKEIPAQAATEISQPGMPQAQTDAAALKRGTEAIPDQRRTSISQPGMTKAQADAEDLRRRTQAVPDGQATRFTQPGMPGVLGDATDLRLRVLQVPGSKSTTISAPGATAAASQARSVRDAVNGIPSLKTTTIRTVRETVNRTVQGSSVRSTEFAAGGLVLGDLERAVRHYAGGGTDIADGHLPELAMAGGPVRVWREPETKGEAYLPLADDWRRPGARAIAEQVVDIFGGRVEWFAAGGLRPGEQTSYVPPALAASGARGPSGTSVAVQVDARGAYDPEAVARRTAARVHDVVQLLRL
ncbi:phage tail tape measure protein [Pseudokineococcus lusitanus]|uniref:TP901 family phage tail tape measure protein n=1 Tax=Pseudokineococcus lusitanus TaxID=763993 RepID=A0A3N1HUE5_9ACTN|nr:phage tail tape measure protein [Pseudokineococcus lusitanus]ROP45952.1 TP901 family phage tail tape measure protein [Pseudokineococcus lusitanus]